MSSCLLASSVELTSSPVVTVTGKLGTKKRGSHGYNKLNKVKLDKLPSGMHSDGQSLYLVVDAQNPASTTAPARRWMMRITVDGRQRDIGLGGFHDATLQEARDKAIDIRRMIKAGQN